MRRLDRLVLASAIFASLACNGTPNPRKPGSHAFRQEVTTRKLPEFTAGLELFTMRGSIRALSDPAREVQRTITVSATSEADAAALAQRCGFEIEETQGHKQRVVGMVPPDCPIERIGADYELRLPSGLDLDLRTRTGLIDTAAYEAIRLRLRSHEGTIRCGPVSERVDFVTTSGGVDLLGRFEEAEGSSVSGSLMVSLPLPGSRLAFTSETGSCTIRVDGRVPVEVLFGTRGGGVHGNGVAYEVTEAAALGFESRPGWKVWRVLIRGIEGAEPCRFVVESRDGDLIVEGHRARANDGER